MAEEEFDPMSELEGEEEEQEEQEGGSPLMRYLPIIVGVLIVQVVIAGLDRCFGHLAPCTWGNG